ncbi:class D sortase [Clostridium estertheticum]|uniref:Class D sortase n=1 Tax=Clostridium estertheticum TaxID=238834 RepID=A0AA47EIH1_9CLOT|nr:class D sortase [Clostridium estertheticum]MBU3155586.1 class D sortase [Clostridium estertheticum]MBU3198109.1 class D sortase [Clostridium estertheticum]WAG60019.1 class D sortase [Clostridium estertheticum]WAG65901.1 class D sortase [Clostridium estertheticum]
MNKLKTLWSKITGFKLMSLVFMGFGIGIVAFAAYSILLQSNFSVNAVPSHISKSATKVANKKLYPVYPKDGDSIGSLTMTTLNKKLPIVQGTGENELKKGVGHFKQSVLPGEKDNCVLSGHRDTVFSGIGKLKIGDQLIVQTSAGIFTYEVKGTRIVGKDDRTVIVPTSRAVLTLTTCYPFNFIGDAPNRYIVSADLIKSK